jgi:hypothetical protein
VASNLDGGLEYESGTAAGTGSGIAAGRALAPGNAARANGSPAAPRTRRAPSAHIDRTTLVTDGGRTAQ